MGCKIAQRNNPTVNKDSCLRAGSVLFKLFHASYHLQQNLSKFGMAKKPWAALNDNHFPITLGIQFVGQMCS